MHKALNEKMHMKNQYAWIRESFRKFTCMCMSQLDKHYNKLNPFNRVICCNVLSKNKVLSPYRQISSFFMSNELIKLIGVQQIKYHD